MCIAPTAGLARKQSDKTIPRVRIYMMPLTTTAAAIVRVKRRRKRDPVIDHHRAQPLRGGGRIGDAPEHEGDFRAMRNYTSA